MRALFDLVSKPSQASGGGKGTAERRKADGRAVRGGDGMPTVFRTVMTPSGRRRSVLAAVVAVAAIAGASAVRGVAAPSVQASRTTSANLVRNPSFEHSNGATYTTFTGQGLGGSSAAAYFYVYNLPQMTTTTDLLPTTLANAGARMMHIVTSAGEGGIVQEPLLGNGPPTAHFSVWVFVVQGQAGVVLGNSSGSEGISSRSTTHGRWEQLTGTNTNSPVQELAIYGATSGVNDFYVDLVSVTSP